MMRVGLFHLTQAQLELLSAMAQRPDLEVVAAVHPDADDTLFKIAQVLEICTGTAPEALREHGAEVVVIPEHNVAVRRQLERLGWNSINILTTRQAADRWGLLEELGDGAVGEVGELDAGALVAGAREAAELDAGESVTGAPDAGAREVGELDAGAPDAGESVAGELEAGARDAGAPDAGESVAGKLEAGAREAGALDAGAWEAGARDTGAPEARGTPPASGGALASRAAAEPGSSGYPPGRPEVAGHGMTGPGLVSGGELGAQARGEPGVGPGSRAGMGGELPIGPDLEVILRDGLDAVSDSDAALPEKLAQLARHWAEIADAQACAILADDHDRLGEKQWVVVGHRANLIQAADPVLMAALEGIPHVYVRHGPAGEEPRRALGAFPLESVRGAIWLLDFRLPVVGSEERLQALRRAARRLGHWLAMEGRVHRLARDRDAAVRVAELAASMAQATSREEILERLIGAIQGEVGADLIVLRTEGDGEPRVHDAALPDAMRAARGLLLAAEEELARAARVSLRTRQQPAMLVGDRVVGGISAPLRRGTELLGTISVFSCQSHGEGELYTEGARKLLERLALHAAGSLALIGHDAARGAGGGGHEGVLSRKELDALLRSEVKRTDRYQVPFLLTVIELAAPHDGDPAIGTDRFSDDFARALRQRLREVDHLASLGRCRFAVLNPHTDRTGGRVVHRAQEVLRELEDRYPGAVGMDVQGNQVLYPGDVPTFEDLLRRLES